MLTDIQLSFNCMSLYFPCKYLMPHLWSISEFWTIKKKGGPDIMEYLCIGTIFSSLLMSFKFPFNYKLLSAFLLWNACKILRQVSQISMRLVSHLLKDRFIVVNVINANDDLCWATEGQRATGCIVVSRRDVEDVLKPTQFRRRTAAQPDDAWHVQSTEHVITL